MTNFLVTFLASFLIWVMFSGLVFLWFVDGRVKKEQVLHSLFACVFAWAFTEMLKSLFPTLRPFEVNGAQVLTITIPDGGAFPSSHSAVAFALAFSIWLHDKKWGSWFVVGALLVGIGRILGNVHYAADILGGAVIGVAITYITSKLHLPNLRAHSKRGLTTSR